MRKILFSMLMGMMALGAMAQGGKFTVKGTFEGRNDSVALVLIDASTGNKVAEEVYPVTGEPIEMSCDLTGAARLFVVKMKNGYQSHMVFPAIPGERLELVKDKKNITQLQGSQFYVDYNKAEQSIEEPHMALENFVGECQYRIQQGESEEQVMKDYEEKSPVLAQALADAVKGYVKAHPDQDAAAALIAMLDDDTDAIEAAAALLTERARGSVAAGLYKSILAESQKEAEEEARQEGMTGNPAPDFTLNDINGKPLALNSLRGKWVIIDFWGSVELAARQVGDYRLLGFMVQVVHQGHPRHEGVLHQVQRQARDPGRGLQRHRREVEKRRQGVRVALAARLLGQGRRER